MSNNLDLTLSVLPSLNKTDYIKLFKIKSNWKKAKGVLFLMDYRLDGKKMTIAIPFRKIPELKLAYKELKKDKIHPVKKTAAAYFSLEQDGIEGWMAEAEIIYGGAKPELLQDKAALLFERIRISLQLTLAEDAELEETVDSANDLDMAEDQSKVQIQNEVDPGQKIKLIIAKLVQLQRQISSHTAISAHDIPLIDLFKKWMRVLAEQLKKVDEETRKQFAETFLKLKKLYQILDNSASRWLTQNQDQQLDMGENLSSSSEILEENEELFRDIMLARRILDEF